MTLNEIKEKINEQIKNMYVIEGKSTAEGLDPRMVFDARMEAIDTILELTEEGIKEYGDMNLLALQERVKYSKALMEFAESLGVLSVASKIGEIKEVRR